MVAFYKLYMDQIQVHTPLLLKDLVTKCHPSFLDILSGSMGWPWELSNKCTMDSDWLQPNGSDLTSRESLGLYVIATASLTLKRPNSNFIKCGLFRICPYDLYKPNIILTLSGQSFHK